jgi:hypothetical protein
MSTPQIISFEGCRTRAEARDRFAAWIDARNDEQVRAVASRFFTDDGAACDSQQFQLEVAELRASFAESRAQCLAIFDHSLEQVLHRAAERS